MSYKIGGTSYTETARVYMYDRQMKKQVTSADKYITVGNDIMLTYVKERMPKPTDTLKPVTFKTNSAHVSFNVAIEGSFDP